MATQRTGSRHNQSFYELIDEAIRDFQLHGFDSQARLDGWLKRISDAARTFMVPEQVLSEQLKRSLTTIFERTSSDKYLVRRHRGIDPFTLAAIRPKLRAELDRRILASASLIRLNRAQSIERTLQRLAGWASSIPKGGYGPAQMSLTTTGKAIKKGLAGLPFIERRVIIDQGNKLTSAINDIVAKDGGAIAAEWHSHYKEAGYDYRPAHKARDGLFYLVRGSWAHQREYVRTSGARFTDQITAPGEEVYCRCFYRYIYNLRDLPETLISKKGKESLQAARVKLAW